MIAHSENSVIKSLRVRDLLFPARRKSTNWCQGGMEVIQLLEWRDGKTHWNSGIPVSGTWLEYKLTCLYRKSVNTWGKIQWNLYEKNSVQWLP